jgi:hypothetical protein
MNRTFATYQVIHLASGVICVVGVCKTTAEKIAREMSGKKPGSVIARRTPRAGIRRDHEADELERTLVLNREARRLLEGGE